MCFVTRMVTCARARGVCARERGTTVASRCAYLLLRCADGDWCCDVSERGEAAARGRAGRPNRAECKYRGSIGMACDMVVETAPDRIQAVRSERR